MKPRNKAYAHIDELRAEFDTRRDAIRTRLREFKAVPPEDYFYELVYCLLTPQSSAVNAGKAVSVLRHFDLLHNELDIAPLLHQDDFYIRFHHTKAKRLTEAKRKFPVIRSHLLNGASSIQLRDWLVRNVKGLGWKEASHFLRNIGHHNLAILDRHILRNLRRHRVLTAPPRTLTPKRYLEIERGFTRFADAVGITLDELDLLFWSRETGEILK
jgi:N-glycosylase/DNA lyase